jgi:hypothetical protein
MVRRTINGLGGRLVGSALLAGLLALLAVSVTTANAQGGMDVGILTPSFSELPLSVQPGETFVIGVSTAPGARCSGQVTFRDHPPIDLEEIPAPSGTCSWSVTVPPTVRPSTGTIVIPITRSGQWWTLYGVAYVRPVGESR